jgi:hypothetical protein
VSNPLNRNTYAFSARFLPAAIVLLPAGFAAAAWFPNRFDGWAFLESLAGWGGLSMLLTQFGRDFGKRKEPDLWKQWGGAPTVQLFRHHGTKLDRHTLARYHKKMKELLPDCRPPTARTENTNPARADAVYQAWTQYLLEATSDPKKFPLIFTETVSYGFRRNLWGMKSIGLAIVIGGIGAALARVVLALCNHDAVPPVAIAAATINVALLAVWLLHIRPAWVLIPAEAFAKRLLAACEHLKKPAAKTKGRVREGESLEA